VFSGSLSHKSRIPRTRPANAEQKETPKNLRDLRNSR